MGSSYNMSHHILSLLLVLSLATSAMMQFTSLSSTEVEAIKKKLRSVVRGPALPTAVRLSFHDCVGGCDGCLNVNNHDNAGLADLVASLDTLYLANSYDSLLSRADFWALAGEFGFDDNETVALLGAHTLGRASSDNSGFSGTWINGEANFFNNEYYKKLVDSSLTWRHRDAGTDNWQWNVLGEVFMLNADVALYKDILVNSVGESSCDFTTCAAAPTATVVEAFAASNDAWIAEFTKVYTKMLAHGNFTLSDLS